MQHSLRRILRRPLRAAWRIGHSDYFVQLCFSQPNIARFYTAVFLTIDLEIVGYAREILFGGFAALAVNRT